MSQDVHPTAQRPTSGGGEVRVVTRKALRFVAALVRLITLLFAAVLVIHVVLTVAGANPANAITVFFRDTAATLTLGISDLFVPANEALRVILNFGLAAVLWILIGMAVSKILLALAPSGSGRGRNHGDR